jgi:Raf kinase inhibitor-like YbhB/YbcL family protein
LLQLVELGCIATDFLEAKCNRMVNRMLEKIPAGVGRVLKSVRAGAEDLAIADTELTGVNAVIEVSSPAFSYNEMLPVQYTADGAGVSPPLEWRCVPGDAQAVVLLLEDADSPTAQPLVHAIVWDLPGADGSLPEGALPTHRRDADTDAMGKNSYLAPTYLPPDPPPGHGAHRYVFQIFALDIAPRFDQPPGRTVLLERIRDHVIAKGLLIARYER